MSASFQAILWNKQKKWYDIVFISAILLYLITYFTINILLFPTLTFETMLIRSFGTLAIIMLHVILSIGPLSRLNSKFLVLLYNRRHLGVTMFLMASVHAFFSILQFHGNGNLHPLISLFVSNTHYNSFIYFPFQTLGFVAYLILMLMAFTSHDFWLSVLSPRIWKTLHLLVYLAYGLLILHILLGVLQLESAPIYFVMLLLGVLWLGILHVYAAYKEYRFDNRQKTEVEGWIKVAAVTEIDNNKAKMIFANGERIAVFKYDNKISAVHNVCKHQNGPLGEGKIIDGCITCPWHGYQYEPANGCAPAPFTEKIATYHTKIIDNIVWIDPHPLPEGTFIAPTIIPNIAYMEPALITKEQPFYIGWQPVANKVFSIFAKKASVVIVCIILLCVLIISFNQSHIATSYFADNATKFEGQLIANPFPALRTVQGKDIYGNPIVKTYPLFNTWKFGAVNAVEFFMKRHGKDPLVQIEGVLLESDGVQLLQLSNGELSIACGNTHSHTEKDSICCSPKYNASHEAILLNSDKAPISSLLTNTYIPVPNIRYIGKVALTGEIIDPKCYFGAMNPGFGKPHRSCAIRCIEGGIMPMLHYKDANGKNAYVVIIEENGEKINTKIGYAVAEPVTLTGKLFTIDNWKVLKVTIPNDLVRLTVKQ
ncbi:Rieske 2Fe-2S domain-containing protein [Parasediminibacterium paludis]|uniref:Rieske 2Fe-2S domain-containing protein n=1 Tax=Parasediminibacterium paludis TaxID=908966 RepID=A0ABV8PYR8_9BACT